MNTGEKVILTKEYNGYPEGTIGYFLFERRDSGTWADIIAIDNEILKEEIKNYEVFSVEQMVQRAQNSHLSLLECSLTTIRPASNESIAVPVVDFLQKIEDVKEELNRLLRIAELIP